MTFTQYLRHLVAMNVAPSFALLLDSTAWPDGSTRLEDYQALLHTHLVAGRGAALLELRSLWSRWVTGPATSADLHADHALAAWRDFAVHLRGCELRQDGPCPRADDLLARAIQESHFHDLASRPADPVPCEDPDDAEERLQDALFVDQLLEVPDVGDLLRERRQQRRSRPHPHQKH